MATIIDGESVEAEAPPSPSGLSSTATWANPIQASPAKKKFAEERLAKCEIITARSAVFGSRT